ncbi:hypothetical protein PG996_011444 [Apiospora saccharicola]|uniref:NACHT-NTPase and P-loop NTPases N-terminal domain-containing protein n=1 Tax=Apiospora saccharicola TaxID=335842 RepID=A0ABR1UF27_9PEZI
MAELVGIVASGISIAELAGRIVAAGLKIKNLLGEIKNVSEDLQDLHEYLNFIHSLGLQLQSIKHNPVDTNSPLQLAIFRCDTAAASLGGLVDELSNLVKEKGIRGKLRAVLQKDMVKNLKKRLSRDINLLSLAYKVASQEYMFALQQTYPDVIVDRVAEKVSTYLDETIVTRLEQAVTNRLDPGALLAGIDQNGSAADCSVYTRVRISDRVEISQQVTINFGGSRPFRSRQWSLPPWLSFNSIKLILDRSQWGWKYQFRNFTRLSIDSEVYDIVWDTIQRDSLEEFRRLVEGGCVNIHDRFYMPLMHDSNDWLRENSMITMAMRSSSWEIFNYLTTHNVEFHGLANVEPWNSTSKSFDGIQKALHAHSENIPIMGVCFAGYNGDYQSLVTLIHSLQADDPALKDNADSTPWRLYMAMSIVARSIISQTDSAPYIVRYFLSHQDDRDHGIILKDGFRLLPDSGVPENTVSLLIFQLAVALITSVLVFPDYHVIGWSELLRDVLDSILLESDASMQQHQIFEALPLSKIVPQLLHYVPWEISSVEWEVAVQVLVQTLSTCSVDLTAYGDYLKDSRLEALTKKEEQEQESLVYGPLAEDWKVWVSEPTDIFVGDFWQVVEHPEPLHVPGAWVEEIG